MINENSSFVSNNSFCQALKDLRFGRYLIACGFNKKWYTNPCGTLWPFDYGL